MSIPRPLLLSLLIALCMTTVAAQSSPQVAPSEPKRQNAELVPDLFQFQLVADTEEAATPTPRAIEDKNDSLVIHRSDSSLPHILTLQQDDAICYTVRAYRVARVSPESDTTKPAGYSTCVPSARFQVRTAVDSRQLAPR
jgi:hypothetical protein